MEWMLLQIIIAFRAVLASLCENEIQTGVVMEDAVCLKWNPQVYQNSQAVIFKNLPRSGFCTYFKVKTGKSSDYYLSTRHCVKRYADVDTSPPYAETESDDPEKIEDPRVWFNHQEPTCLTSKEDYNSQKAIEAAETGFGPNIGTCVGKVVDWSTKPFIPDMPEQETLDEFAIMELQHADCPYTKDTPVVRLYGGPSINLKKGDPIYTVGYPNGWARKISTSSVGDDMSSCRLHGMDDTTSSDKFHGGAQVQQVKIQYQCDTLGGNSGGPIFHALTHQVIAIHSLGGCSADGSEGNRGSLISTERIIIALKLLGIPYEEALISPDPSETADHFVSGQMCPLDKHAASPMSHPKREVRTYKCRKACDTVCILQSQPPVENDAKTLKCFCDTSNGMEEKTVPKDKCDWEELTLQGTLLPEDQQPQPSGDYRLAPGEPFLTLTQCQVKCCKSLQCGGIQFKPMGNFASARIRLKVGKATPTQKLIQDSTIGVCKFYDVSKPLKLHQKAPTSLSDILSPAVLQDQKNRLLKTLSGLSKEDCKAKCLETLACTGVEYNKEKGSCVIVQKYSQLEACRDGTKFYKRGTKRNRIEIGNPLPGFQHMHAIYICFFIFILVFGSVLQRKESPAVEQPLL